MQSWPSNEPPIIFKVVLKLIANRCGCNCPVDQLSTKGWTLLSINLHSTYDPWNWGTAKSFFGTSHTKGHPSLFPSSSKTSVGVGDMPTPWMVNFSQEVWVRGALVNTGWRSTARSAIHTVQIHSAEAYVVIMLGVYTLNVLIQILNVDDTPLISIQECIVNPAGIEAFGPSMVMARTTCLCTIISYNSGIDLVRAMCLVGGNVTTGGSATLRSWMQYANIPTPTVGLSATSFEQATQSPANYHVGGICTIITIPT